MYTCPTVQLEGRRDYASQESPSNIPPWHSGIGFPCRCDGAPHCVQFRSNRYAGPNGHGRAAVGRAAANSHDSSNCNPAAPNGHAAPNRDPNPAANGHTAPNGHAHTIPHANA